MVVNKNANEEGNLNVKRQPIFYLEIFITLPKNGQENPSDVVYKRDEDGKKCEVVFRVNISSLR